MKIENWVETPRLKRERVTIFYQSEANMLFTTCGKRHPGGTQSEYRCIYLRAHLATEHLL